MRRDSAPRRETGQDIAVPLAGSVVRGSGYRNDVDTIDNLQAIPLRGISDYGDGLPQLRAKSGDCGGGSEVLVAYGGNNTSGPIPVATARSAHGGPHGRLDFETETFLVQCNGTNVGVETDLSGTLREGNHNVTAGWPVITFDTTQITSPLNRNNPQPGDPCHPRASTAHAPAIAMNAHAFDARMSDVIQYGNLSGPLDTDGQSIGVLSRMQVRRLTVIECERLQGLPDNYTFVRDPRTRKRLEADYLAYLLRHSPNLDPKEAEVMAKDGPRYRAIGNGMAVPCVAWILERLDRHMKGEL